ncbi:MAG: M23 family metallopeptidase [Patescibacteria group bacterium]
MAIAAFRAVRSLKRALQYGLASIWKLIAPAVGFFVRHAIFPFYRLGVTSRLRFHRLALPAKGFVLFLLTNRYLFHATILLLSIVTVAGNFQVLQAHAQDVGQQSLLFALATDQKSEIVEESFRPENASPNSKYMGSASVVSVPHIDFDYDTAEADVTTGLEIPGTVAALPLDLTEGPKVQRTRTETYTVQENDTLGNIAQRFGVNIGTILWNNGLQERQYIRPGDTLRIPPTSGVIVKIKSGDTLGSLANKYGGDVTEIANFNNFGEGEKLAAGTELMIPGGRPPELEQTSSRIARQTEVPSSESISKLTAPRPVPKPADLETKEQPKTKLLWPTSGHSITQYYGWRHVGLDVDGDFTSPLYAAADGVIESAGWNNAGYGLMIFIDHKNGIKTRYGHASKLFVKKGDVVKRGQVIAMMGTTGRSTGSHLHFEVYVNGKRTNPLGYIR